MLNSSRFDLGAGSPVAQWVDLVYRCNIFEQPSRPRLRIEHDGRETVIVIPGPLFHTGRWTGRIPANTTALELVCGDDCRQGIVVEQWKILTAAGLTRRALGQGAGGALTAAWRLASEGWSEDVLRQAVLDTPLGRYDQWRRCRLRPLDPGGADRPQHDWRSGIHVLYVCRADGADDRALGETIASLAGQVYPHWSLVLLGARRPAYDGARLKWLPDGAASPALLAEIGRQCLVSPVRAGNRVADYAAAAVAEFMARFPKCRLIYGDEDEISGTGRYGAPVLKPDWSPTFQQATRYVGDAVYLHESLIRSSGLSARQIVELGNAPSLLGDAAEPVSHLRRILLTRRTPAVRAMPSDIGAAPARPEPRRAAGEATLIIPTKDRADLLEACLASLPKVQQPDYDIVLVDNGSQEQGTFDLYARLAADSRIRIVSFPGPFNFAAMCNAGARDARTPFFVFLNNDTEALDNGWLGRLTAWAGDPTVGAVGATLLYPSGRLQHGGLVLGMRGNAGHIDIGARGNDAGYLGRLRVPREVSAVTGACLAVERHKFEAVGGFDAEAFPVELNDVDLCLRLAARGWRTLMVPDCRLVHHESATRGRTRDANQRYPVEHRTFRHRWASVIANDPYFHPALTLTSTRAALG